MPGLRFIPPRLNLVFDPAGDAARPWVVSGDHHLANDVVTVTIPSGFRCDLASVPAWLLWLFPPNGSHQRAAVFHDALYRFRRCERVVADAVFESIMQQDGVVWWRRKLIYLAVRLFGGSAWRAHVSRKARKGGRG